MDKIVWKQITQQIGKIAVVLQQTWYLVLLLLSWPCSLGHLFLQPGK